jgi:putative flavoprotein involved in K+ transport
MPESSVVIVGGGAAGLSSAAALAERGIEAVVLEQDVELGGTWTRRYERLHLHTVRRFSGLAHLPIPRRYPTYLSRDEVVEYLQAYAKHFNLRVVTGTTVERIRQQAGSRRQWAIEVREAGMASRQSAWCGRVVIVATGQYREPVTPAWPGRDLYTGRLVHSAAYVNARPYAGLRVLVVGAGNSGAEIATDLSGNGAAVVALSVRTPPVVVPRDPFGMPVQRTSILLSAMPAAVSNRLGSVTARMTIGDLTKYGMPKGKFTPYTTRRVPLIDVGFVEALKRGRVTIRPAVSRLTPAGVVFADGASEAFDAIVAATGFRTGLESLLDAEDLLDGAGEPVGRAGDPTARPGLYFIGFVHTLRGHLFEANRTSRRLARNVERYLTAAG